MSIKFDNVEIPSFIKVKKLNVGVLPPITPIFITVPGRAGQYDIGDEIGAREITIEYTMLYDSFEDMREKMREFAAWLKPGQKKRLVLLDEPDKYYIAKVTGESSLDENYGAGEGSITFLCSDPYKYSEEKTQTIDSSRVAITEDNRNDWLAGSISNLEVTAGGDLRLIKAGTDFSGAVDIGWETGTHSGTIERDNTRLELAYETLTGTNFSQTDDSISEFGTGTLTNVTVSNNSLVLLNRTDYDLIDNMNNVSTGWTVTGNVIQHAGYVRIYTPGTGGGAIRQFGLVTFPCTVDFHAQTYGDPGTDCWIHVSDGNTYYLDFPLPQLTGEGNWGWYRVRYLANGDLVLYLNGTLVGTYSMNTSSPTSNRLSFGVDSGAVGTFLLDSVYFINEDLGAPDSSTYNFSGSRVSTYDISSVKKVESSNISWNWINQTNTIDNTKNSITIETSLDGVNYTPVANNSSIPDIDPGDDLTGTTLYIKQTLNSKDPGSSPSLDSLTIEITRSPDEYYLSGSRESTAITAMRSAGRLANTSFSWIENKPEGTNIKAFTQVSFDGGDTWSSWKEVTNGGTIPDLPPGTDISNLSFKYKFDLTTSDKYITPAVDRAEYKFFAGYVEEGERISPPVDLTEIEVAGNSYIAWDDSPDLSPNIEIYGQLVNKGDPPNPLDWVQLTSEQPIIAVMGGTSLIDKELYLKQVLKSPDATSTPILHRIEWWMDGNADKSINYSDTTITTKEITTLPNYSYRDNFTNYVDAGWSVEGTVQQQPGFIRIEKPNIEDVFFIHRHDKELTTPYTIDFRARVDGDWSTFVFCANMTNRYDVALPDTGGEWKWFRFVGGASEGYLYEFGGTTYGPYSPSGGGYYSIGFAVYGGGVGTLDIDCIYITNGNLGIPTDTSWNVTEIGELEIGVAEVINSASIDWNWTNTAGTIDTQNVTLETRVTNDGVNWSNWQPIATGIHTIPDILLGEEIQPNAKIEYRATLTTTDPGYSPKVSNLSINIDSAVDSRVIRYWGTVETYPTILVEFQKAVSDRFELLHLETGNRVIVNNEFSPGDTLLIDCDKKKISINGILAMESLSMRSDFFSLSPGLNTIITSPAGASKAILMWVETWR